MTSSSDSAALRERYGTDRPGRLWRRRLVQAGIAALVAAFLGWVGWAGWFHGTPQISSDLISFEIVDEHSVTARFGVVRRSDSVVGSCDLRAFAEDHTTVGEVTIAVPASPGPLTQTLTHAFLTERRATSVELVGCTAKGQPRPR